MTIEAPFDKFLEIKVQNDKFLVVKETLTRIGVCPKNKKTLYQSCHILFKEGKYYIVHFKELFLLENKESSMDEIDVHRRNQIAKLLQDWGLVTILNPSKFPVEDHYMKLIKIVPASQKDEWTFVQKYHLGGRTKPAPKNPSDYHRDDNRFSQSQRAFNAGRN